LEPETRTEPSARRMAVEWYMRSWGEAERPVRENLEPAGAFGLTAVSSECQLIYRGAV
jgi:hypothetical protein